MLLADKSHIFTDQINLIDITQNDVMVEKCIVSRLADTPTDSYKNQSVILVSIFIYVCAYECMYVSK